MPTEFMYTVGCESCGRPLRTSETFSDPSRPKPVCSFCEYAKGVTTRTDLEPSSTAPEPPYVNPIERQAAALERIAAALEHLAQAHPIRRQP